MAFTIRPALEAETPLILTFIKELAEYEKLSHAVSATEEQLRSTLFGPRPAAESFDSLPICTLSPLDKCLTPATTSPTLSLHGKEIGFALFFHNYSTFLAKRGLYLEDLYIREAYRRKGYGRKLLRYLARIAVERDCGRFEWSALNWNTPAINFYRGLGAISMDDWMLFRLTGEPLRALANEKDS